MIKKENKNILKYNNHEIKIQQILNVKIKTISVIREATGPTLLSLVKNLCRPRKTLRRVVTYPGSTQN